MSRIIDNKFIDVFTGKVDVSSKLVTLRAMAIGSSVAVVVYDRYKKVGGLTHVMFPGRSLGRNGEERTKYAEDAIDILLHAAKKLGVGKENLEVSLVGGADVFGEGNLSGEVLESVLGYLKKLGIEPKNKNIGGTYWRSVSLDIGSGKIFYTEARKTLK